MELSNVVILHGAIALVILSVAELIFFRKEHFSAYYKKDLLASISLGVASLLVGSLAKGTVLVIFSIIYEYRVFSIGTALWWAWPICFLADDLSFYWFHRMSHKIRFLWASHSVHHSCETFSLASALRVPVTSHLTGSFLFWAWMPLVGFEPAMILTMKAISLTYQFFVHTEAVNKLPVLIEAVFVTPSHHRVHHGSNDEYLDKNHGGVLIIWDKLFGSFKSESLKPVYGLANKMGSTNPVIISLKEYQRLISDMRKAKSARECFNYMWSAPGWSKDGTSKTVKQIQAKLEESRTCDTQRT